MIVPLRGENCETQFIPNLIFRVIENRTVRKWGMQH